MKRDQPQQSTGFSLNEMIGTIRLDRGYRFLDVCGEIVIRLEDTLGPGWIPDELVPQGGKLKNIELGAKIHFNAEWITMTMTDGVFVEDFISILSSAYEVVCGLTKIEKVITPALRTVWLKKAPSLNDAEELLNSMQLVSPSPQLLDALGGEPTVHHATVTRESEIVWKDLELVKRVRLTTSSRGTITQPLYDPRLVKRVKLMPSNQREAMQALMKLRETSTSRDSFAVAIDLEHSFEGELAYSVFPCREYLEYAYNQLSDAVARLNRKAK